MMTVMLALLVLAPQAAVPAADPVAADAPAAQGPIVRDTHEETQLERDTRQLASELRCPVCQGLSLQDSPAELSQEMRAIIREQLTAGKSVAEVKEYFVDKYGEWILLEPKASGFNLAVYILPVLGLLGGAVFVYVQARKWTRHPRTDLLSDSGYGSSE